jgi:hypothetical protein
MREEIIVSSVHRVVLRLWEGGISTTGKNPT